MKSRRNHSCQSMMGRWRMARAAQHGARGAALLTSLILLTLLSAASLGMVLLASSDMLVNGYYRNYRGSFYAADSGVNVVVEAINNAILASGAPNANPPLPNDGTIPAAVINAYTPYLAGYYTIGDNGSWKGKFQLTNITLGTGAAACTSTPNPSVVRHTD